MKPILDPATEAPDDIAKYILASKMPLSDEEKDFLNDIAHNESYIYYGLKINVVRLHRLRILFWMTQGFLRG